ncbi:MAG: TetR/AcrR family transcriptional regulator [Ignavibacteria bacterium]|nr:TetR/AcrR family transcriptional regulator [Ignavibacteria bacterium]
MPQSQIVPIEEDIPKELIIRVATALFLERGYSNTSSELIAKTCKVSKKTVYKIFGSKEELLRAVAARITERAELTTDHIFSSPEMPIADRFTRMLQNIDNDFARLRSQWFLDDIRLSAPQVWHEFIGWREYRIQLIYGLLREVAENKMLTEGVGPGDVMKTYISLLTNGMDKAFLKEFEVSSEDLYEALTQVLMHGLLVREAHID